MPATSTKKISTPKANKRSSTRKPRTKKSPDAASNDEANSSQDEDYAHKSELEDEEYHHDATQNNKRKRKTQVKSATTNGGKTAGKRAGKKAKKSIVEKQGPLLGPLSEMPFDVLLEIFTWIGPPELLSLSQTSSDLRKLMKSSDLESTWRKAISQGGLPECPSSMSLPRFVELAYGKGCHSCGKNSGNIYHIWEANTRLCTQCVPVRGYSPTMPLVSHKFMKKHVPTVEIRNRLHYSHGHIDKWEAEAKLAKRKKLALRWETEKIAQLEQITNHAIKCRTWHSAFLEAAAHERENEVNQRKESVVKLIKELGWGHELSQTPANSLPHNRSDIQKICQNKLTDYAIKSLKSKLPIIMQELKDRRLSREYEATRRMRLKLLESTYEKALKAYWPPEKYRPHVADVLRIPHILEMVNLPADSGDVKFKFDECREALTGLINEARMIIDQKIFSLVVSGSAAVRGDKMSVTDATSLARILFFNIDYYDQSTPRYFYTVAQALESSNARRYSDRLQKACTNTPDFDAAAYDVLQCGPWDMNNQMRINEEACAAASAILEYVFGLDPLTTTTETMDHLNPIVECLGCNSLTTGRMMMTWTALIQHHLLGHQGHIGHQDANTSEVLKKYRLLTDQNELSEVRRRMKEVRMRDSYMRKLKAVCMHCGRVDQIDKLRGHLNLKHNKAFPEDNDVQFIYATDFRENVRKDDQGDVYRMWPPRPPTLYIEVEEGSGTPDSNSDSESDDD